MWATRRKEEKKNKPEQTCYTLSMAQCSASSSLNAALYQNCSQVSSKWNSREKENVNWKF